MLRRRVIASCLGTVFARSIHATGLLRATDAKTVRAPHKYEQFAYMENAEYLSKLLDTYNHDKLRVDPSWWPILDNLASASPDQALLDTFSRHIDPSKSGLSEKERIDNMKVAWMVRAWEYRGHHVCDLDPIGMFSADLSNAAPAGLDPASFGFSEADMERVFHINLADGLGVENPSGSVAMKLKEIISRLREIYGSQIGFEFMHAGFSDVRNWFREEIMATHGPTPAEYRKRSFQEVVKACGFEKFLHTKYASQKRFGLDGAESLIPGINAALDMLSCRGADTVILGMPHRGRLNMLVNVAGKSLEKIFNEFEGRTPKSEVWGTADVKYHMGIETRVTTYSNKPMLINLMPNPSHLECINPLVLGKTRFLQNQDSDKTRTKIVPILLHGDAAFAGQGICYETMGLSDLDSFAVGGAIHFVVNNQVGFTTDPWQSRSSNYCTDLCKVNNAPVIHVNADNVDQVVRASRIAAKFRQVFRRDVIIDLVCYRRNGHNETDVPMFTQPTVYRKIAKHPVVVDIYADELVKQNVLSADQVKATKDEYNKIVRTSHERALADDSYIKVKNAEQDGEYDPVLLKNASTTGLPISVLKQIGMAITQVPPDFKMHPKAEGPMRARREAVTSGTGVEWCLAEGLAMGSLAMEGFHVRLTGQDVERGTFSQRLAVLVDSTTNMKYMPLSRVSPDQALVTISNSSLSEFGVSGFETGFAMDNDRSLCMWEAQFGDFANGAQVIFDQFLSSCEAKWIKQNSLCISLPHGYDGQGPEHSSARIERFLQLNHDSHAIPANYSPNATEQDLLNLSETRIRDTNWQVCYPSRPANYFHMLRRQVHRSFRKPLIFAFAKSGLRAPNLSLLEEMGPNTHFKPVIVSKLTPEATKVRKLVICTGHIERKIRLSVELKRKESGNADLHSDVTFLLLEQIAPFPWEHIAQAINPFIKANPELEIIWLQEEPKNMGAWSYVRPRLNLLLPAVCNKPYRISYVGRPPAASPATGYEYVHVAEEKAIFDAVLS